MDPGRDQQRQSAREAELDPDDAGAELERRLAGLRSGSREAATAALRPLLDRELWGRTPEALQDLAIQELGRRIDEDFAWLATTTFACAGLEHRIAAFRHRESGAVLHLLPAGRFVMGRDDGPRDARPAHAVHIRRPFLIGRTPLRQDEWRRIMPSNPSHHEGADRPVEKVSWWDAVDWTRAAGSGLRLPSEAEWEYACRAGSTTRYFWGEEWEPGWAWCGRDSRQTRAVERHADRANAFGLVDGLGNVYEWCLDAFLAGYEHGPHDEQPFLNEREQRVSRGGHWRDLPADLGCSERMFENAHWRGDDQGFRLAANLPLDDLCPDAPATPPAVDELIAIHPPLPPGPDSPDEPA